MRILAGPGGVDPVAVVDGAPPGGDVRSLDLRDATLRAALEPHCPDLGGAGSGDVLRCAVAAVAAGRLDGAVAGAVATTADVLRAGLRILGTVPEGGIVSGAFYMVVPGRDGAQVRVLTFADAAVVPHPDAEQLASIARSACAARRSIVGDAPRVAFLSYATRGSAGGESVERVREAAAAFRRLCPDVPSDGELQADAALVPSVASRKAPGSPVGGDANILIFPNLDAANIGYKLVERLAGARAVGPILQGLAAPLNDLSRGASIEDIVRVARVTALQAAGRAANHETEQA
jgi:phosphate acetyltransferase